MALHHRERLEWQEPSAEEAAKLQEIFRSYEDHDEGGMLRWAKREPQLFRFLLGPDFGPQVTERGTDSYESQTHNTAGTFAMFAVNRGFHQVVEALLEAGVRPDDRHVFINRPLIEHPTWRANPKLLVIALSHCTDASSSLLSLAASREWASLDERRQCDLLLLALGSLPAAIEDGIRKRMRAPPSPREHAWATEVLMRVRVKQLAAEQPKAEPMAPAPERRRKCV